MKYLYQFTLTLFFVLGLSYTTTAKDSIRIRIKADTIRTISKTHIFRIDTIPDIIYKDTTRYKYIKPDTSKNFSSFILKQLFKSVKMESTADDNSLVEVTKFNSFNGSIIDTIIINSSNVFEKNKSGHWVQKLVNGLHIVTQESTIKRFLLFKSGEQLDPEMMTKSEAMLRESGNLSQANIEVMPSDKEGHVNIYVTTADTWSIAASVNYRYTNNGHLRLSDNNFLGLGHRLDVTEYFNLRRKEYLRATEITYQLTNIGGTFIDVKAGAGYGIDYLSVIAQINKPFIKNNDYAFGARYNLSEDEIQVQMAGDFSILKRREMDVWYGQSINISPRWGDNLFFAVKGERIINLKRPFVKSNYNPFFHNSTDALASFGFYKEKFYRGNMIYGFGRTEAISYGYKTEVVGGYRWGEFFNAPYMGIKLSMGNMVKIGYLSGNVSLGAFWDKEKKEMKQAKINASLLYFTRLHYLGQGCHLRQFLRINYNGGFNLMTGYDDYIQFNNRNELSAVAGRQFGSTHFAVNPESVFFTPLHVSGFRFAFFWFADMGTIGKKGNPFSNPFFATSGIGVRIRNESLIFRTIQFRLVIGIKTTKEFNNTLFYLNSEPALRTNTYIPTDPQMVRYHIY